MHNKIKAKGYFSFIFCKKKTPKTHKVLKVGLNGSLLLLNEAFESGTSKISCDYTASQSNFANQPDYKMENKNHF